MCAFTFERGDIKGQRCGQYTARQLMGFDARPGWRGWDSVEAQMPQSELHGLIIDLRSLTQGVGTFEVGSIIWPS